MASLLCLGAAAAQGQTDASPSGAPPVSLAERARRVLQEQDSQLELPTAGDRVDGPSRRAPERTGSSAPAGRGRGSAPRSVFGGPAGFSIAEPVLWLLVALAVLGLVIAIVRGLAGRAPRVAVPARPRPEVRSEPVGEDTPATLPEHERLAARGDFAAAIHVLVGHAVQVFADVAGAVPLHATAREVVRRARARSMTTDDFAALVRTFEVVHFGGRGADRALYESSRAQLEQWRAACRPGT